MRRLAADALANLPAEIRRPGFDRARATAGIVHLGIGAFHRGHMAAYTDDAMAAGELGWGIVGASLRSPETRDALEPQDGLYTLALRDDAGESLRVIGSILDVRVAPEDPAGLVDALADPAIRIVSLTVTEKGYCHDPSTGKLDERHPDILHDLDRPQAPRSVPGFIVEALARRRQAGTPSFTVLSCDNLPANGLTAKRVLARFAVLRDPDLGRFVEAELACPSTMVDRIVPATTDADRAEISARLGVEDRWPVVAEPFTQWVVEDRFPGGRPAWPDVTFVDDVEPFELMKLRLLNGSHSTLAYLGYLAGHDTVADAMARPALAALIAGLMDDEVTPTLPRLPGIDLAAYKADLLSRFRNRALKHRTWQIAMDGSQKLPQRLLGTIRDRLAADRPFDRLALGVAAWMRYVAGVDEAGRAIDVRDPLAAVLRERADAARGEPQRLVALLLGEARIFGADLPQDVRFTEAVTGALSRLHARGGEQAAADMA